MDYSFLISKSLQKLGVKVSENSSAVAWTLRVDDSLVIELELLARSEELFIYSYFFPMIEGSTACLCKKVMEANELEAITTGQTISISKSKSMFVLSQKIELDNCDEEQLVKKIIKFYSQLNYLNKKFPEWQVSSFSDSLSLKQRLGNDAGKIIFK